MILCETMDPSHHSPWSHIIGGEKERSVFQKFKTNDYVKS